MSVFHFLRNCSFSQKLMIFGTWIRFVNFNLSKSIKVETKSRKTPEKNSQENTFARVFFYIKKKTLAQLFSSEFCEISKNTFFTEHLCDDCFCITFTLPFVSQQYRMILALSSFKQTPVAICDSIISTIRIEIERTTLITSGVF